ncbi:alpha-L-fucosidase [Xylella fastidiosa]|uniref:alpha-L-fucosidase n=1 Tax=Xylella fastidiosa TaxID=2371 RepID=UPI0003D39FA3|nr:alpha-L-fucosidase [Xylella fastidiosa]ALR05167.1 alpha-L-fucosidase [Xylella fastidiosa]KXB22305.1 alpha-L-fucosidase [Xylella fastidiosa]OJZ69349.1 alpha-L-fucosidase [Xylella fastidiosa 6c]
MTLAPRLRKNISRKDTKTAPLTHRLTLLLTLLPLPSFAAAPPPANTDSPEQIDQQWLQATARYAPERDHLVHIAHHGATHGPFRPDWPSLKQYRSPDWYNNAKFGIFIHWGVFSVPAFGSEWYSRNMYQQGSKEYQHHLATYGPQNTFGYKDFIPQFTASTFDPNAWATLFKQAGARYVVPLAEHHDGFALYDSHLSDWTAVKTGPKRDLLGELSTAIRAQGLHFGLSSHRAEHNWFFDGGRQFDSDINDPHYADLYGPAQRRLAGKTDEDVANDWTPVSQAWLNDWLARTTELIDRYAPELIYFDWWIAHPAFRNTLPTLLAYYYNHGQTKNTCHAPPHHNHTPSTAPSPPAPITSTHLTSTTTQPQCGVVVNYKLGALPDGAGTLDIERGQLTGIHPTHWQTDTSISNASWGYIENDTYKSPTFIIHMLADVVAKNGNLLLNIGPRADGSIPDAERTILLNIGKWLNINGTAIYDTHPWRTYGEGPTEVAGGTFQDTKTKPYTAEDFRFTVHGDTLYAIELGWPTNGQTVIHSINASDNVYSVTLLADNRPIPFEQHNDGLHLHLPNKPVGEHAYVFRITTHTH